MRMEQFRYLLEISKQRSITRAARTLYLGQNTLSAIVKSVEEELGFEMFTRAQKGVCCTPEGEEAMPLIAEIEKLYQEMLEVDPVSAESRHIVNVLLSPTINSALAVPLSRRFYTAVPNGSLDFRQVSGRDVTSMLVKDEAKIGLTYLSDHTIENFHTIATKYQLKVEKLLDDRHYLLVAKDHPLAALDQVVAADLVDLDFALLPHYFRDEGARYLATLGSGNRFVTYSNISLIKHAVATSNMVTIMMGFTIFYNNSVDIDRFKIIKLADRRPLSSNLCVIHREEDSLHPMDRRLLQCMMDHFHQLSPIDPFAGEEER